MRKLRPPLQPQYPEANVQRTELVTFLRITKHRIKQILWLSEDNLLANCVLDTVLVSFLHQMLTELMVMTDVIIWL